MTCVLVNGTVALDAGSLSQGLSIERQRRVTSVVLSHSHMDHTCSLPFFIENSYAAAGPGLAIHASRETIYAVRRNLFNDAAWPDFTRIPHDLAPAVRFVELEAEVPTTIGGVRFTPIAVDHLVPTFGFLIESRGTAVLWSSDTGPTVRLWEVANQTPSLAAVFIETSFDDARHELAELSGHLTPATLAGELEKLRRRLPIYVHGLKPPYVESIRRQIAALGHPDVQFVEQGRSYSF